LLGLDEEAAANFELWLKTVFAERLSFEELARLCPLKPWNVVCRPVRDDGGRLSGVLVVASEGSASESKGSTSSGFDSVLGAEGEPVAKLVRLASGRQAFRLFVSEMEELLHDLLDAGARPLEENARRLHTAKGGAVSFAMRALGWKLHEVEARLVLARDGRLDKNVLNAELAAQVPELRAALNAERKSLRDLLFLLASDVAPLTSKESAVVDAPVAIGSLFGHQEIALRELAESLGKKLASFEVVGGDILVTSRAQRTLASTLIHALRNSVFHGLETPAVRKKSRKDEGGKIRIEFKKAGGAKAPILKIEISDDGRGVDLEKVREKLEEIEQHALASAEDEIVVQALLEGALSTASSPGPVAGSGLGLAAIAAEVGRMNGTIRLSSTRGRGLTVHIEVPYAADVVAPSRAA
jgi:chemotaxis protein histidine kinase CheA